MFLKVLNIFLIFENKPLQFKGKHWNISKKKHLTKICLQEKLQTIPKTLS